MKKRKPLLITFSFAVLFFISIIAVGCSTPKKEYVIVSPDYLHTFQPLLAVKPSDPDLVKDVKTVEDIMRNSIAFQQAYYDWRSYSESLEQAILSVFQP